MGHKHRIAMFRRVTRVNDKPSNPAVGASQQCRLLLPAHVADGTVLLLAGRRLGRRALVFFQQLVQGLDQGSLGDDQLLLEVD